MPTLTKASGELKTANLTPIEISNQIVKLAQAEQEIKVKLLELKGQLLAEMAKLDVLTLKTGQYLIARKTRTNIKVEDKKALELNLKEFDIPIVYAIDLDYMRPVINSLVNEGNNLDGVVTNKTEYVSITVNKKGKNALPEKHQST